MRTFLIDSLYVSLVLTYVSLFILKWIIALGFWATVILWLFNNDLWHTFLMIIVWSLVLVVILWILGCISVNILDWIEPEEDEDKERNSILNIEENTKKVDFYKKLKSKSIKLTKIMFFSIFACLILSLFFRFIEFETEAIIALKLTGLSFAIFLFCLFITYITIKRLKKEGINL